MSDTFIVGGDSYTFNGPSKLIEIGLGSSTFSITDCYSFWKQWVSLGNAQYLPAWRIVGGDDLGGGQRVPVYGFLINQWRVSIPIGISTYVVTDGVLKTEELDSPFIYDGLQIIIEAPISVLTVEVPTDSSDTINNINTNVVGIQSITNDTYDSVVSIGATLDDIRPIVVDTNNRVIGIGSTVNDIKRNTNLIPGLF